MPTLASLMDTLGGAMNYLRDAGTSADGSSVLPGVRGAARGAVLGLEKYPAAAVMKVMDLVRGGKMTWSEALDALNRQQEQDRAEHPVAAYGGELAGALMTPVPGSAAKGAGTTMRVLASPTLRGAAQGGIASFNENQDLGEGLTGAALGAVTGGAAGLAQLAGKKIVKKVAERAINKNTADFATTAEKLDDDIIKAQAKANKARMAANRAVKTDAPTHVQEQLGDMADLAEGRLSEAASARTRFLEQNGPYMRDLENMRNAQHLGEALDMYPHTTSRLIAGDAQRSINAPGALSDLVSAVPLAGIGYAAFSDPNDYRRGVLGALMGAAGSIPLVGKSKVKLGASLAARYPNAPTAAAQVLNRTVTPYAATAETRALQQQNALASQAANEADVSDLDAMEAAPAPASAAPRPRRGQTIDTSDLDSM